ncbi:hypothetical protein BV898_18714 [Hypsibius exemplaris]|uniref:Uncharacterized protein n=1 Tax=Hypsibius exemplaris TaxID=2072580 RepID=A0A9X6RP38_HYPEX|nr:hypothetical protein BV898_18714 [Hypsibius exemplaris]
MQHEPRNLEKSRRGDRWPRVTTLLVLLVRRRQIVQSGVYVIPTYTPRDWDRADVAGEEVTKKQPGQQE